MHHKTHLTNAAVATAIASVLFVASRLEADPAKVLDVSRCTILDGNGALYKTTEKNQAVYNKNGDHLKCDAKDVPNDAKKTVHYDKASTGYQCSTGQHMTDDWKLTVSASGNAMLTCKFKFPKAEGE
jgi:hypothetical protein